MNLRILAAIAVALGLTACGTESAPAPETPKKAQAPAPHVADHTSLFPDAGKLGASIIQDHIFDMAALPGGSLADYEVKGKKYQMFIIDADSIQNAAFMMLDMKSQLGPNPVYLAHMGGYFGRYKDQPFYCFSKLHYLAGIVGLPQDKADALARDLAAQLH